MTNLRNLRDRPFLIVDTIQRVAPGVNTKEKGWANKPSNWQIFEQPRVEDRVNNRTMTNAQVIVDITAGKVIKSRFFDKNDDEVAEHYLGKYMEECKRGLDVWLTRQARQHLASADQVKAMAEEMRQAASEAQPTASSGVVGGEATMRIIPAPVPPEGQQATSGDASGDA